MATDKWVLYIYSIVYQKYIRVWMAKNFWYRKQSLVDMWTVVNLLSILFYTKSEEWSNFLCYPRDMIKLVTAVVPMHRCDMSPIHLIVKSHPINYGQTSCWHTKSVQWFLKSIYNTRSRPRDSSLGNHVVKREYYVLLQCGCYLKIKEWFSIDNYQPWQYIKVMFFHTHWFLETKFLASKQMEIHRIPVWESGEPEV